MSTGISWTDETWNPTRGCRRVSAGCENCYAERQANRFSGPGQPYDGLVKSIGGKPRWTGETMFSDIALELPLSWRKPRRIFVDSMSDLFYEGFTDEQIDQVFGVMALAPPHTFQILTKRAARMRSYLSDENVWPRIEVAARKILYKRQTIRIGGKALIGPLPHIWLGVSIENQEAADTRIPDLMATPAAIRFLSCEPLIGRVDLDKHGLLWRPCSMCNGSMSIPVDGGGMACPRCFDHQGIENAGISWVIAGCESGSGARPCEVSWLRRLRDDCKGLAVPFFLKQAVDGGSTVFDVDSQGCAYGITCGTGSKAKGGGVVELPYLDGVQHAAFPT